RPPYRAPPRRPSRPPGRPPPANDRGPRGPPGGAAAARAGRVSALPVRTPLTSGVYAPPGPSPRHPAVRVRDGGHGHRAPDLARAVGVAAQPAQQLAGLDRVG